MNRDTVERICLWAIALATCLGAAVAVFILRGVFPDFMENSTGSVLARLALVALFFGLFVAAHHSVRRVLTNCDRACSDEHLLEVRPNTV